MAPCPLRGWDPLGSRRPQGRAWWNLLCSASTWSASPGYHGARPTSRGSNLARGCAGQNHSVIYCLRCGAVLGMGERLMGGGPTPPRGAACAFLGRVPPEAESRRCAHAASDIIIILIMKGQLLQSSSPLRWRERRMQRRCVSLIPSSRGESTAMPGQSSAGPMTPSDKKLMPGLP